MPKTKEQDFLATLPNSENDFLSGIPDATPSGLPKLNASATPTIDNANQSGFIQTDPALITSSLQAGSATPAPAPTQPPAPAPTDSTTAPVDKTQLGVDAADAALTAGGMALGGMAGTAAAVALAPETAGISLLIPALGAALGYGVGKSGSDLLQRAIGKKPLLNDFPDALTETAQTAKEGAMLEMGGQVAGKAITATGEKVLAPMASKAGEAGKEALDWILTKAEQYGIKLTPGELVQSKRLQLLENFLSNVPFVGGRIEEFRNNQIQTLLKARDHILENNGGEQALEEIGLRIRNLVDDSVNDYRTFSEENLARLKDRVLQKAGSYETYHDLIQPIQQTGQKRAEFLQFKKNTLYDNVKDMMPDDLTTVPDNLSTTANNFKNELGLTNQTLQDKQALQIASSLADKTPQSVAQLIENRKALNGLLSKETNFITGETTPTGRMYGQMINALDKDIGAAVDSTGNQTLIDTYKIANKANADYKNYLQDPLVKKIAESKKPEGIVAAIYTPNNDSEIQRFQKLYGKDVTERAKKVFTNSFLGLNSDPAIPDAPLTGDFVRKQMQRYGGTLNSIYSPPEINYMRRMADVLDGKAEVAAEVIKNPVFRSVLGSSRVSGMIDLIVKPKDVGNFTVIKKYVGEPAVKEIQNGLLNKLLVKNQINNFAPQTFAKDFYKYEPRVLKEVLPPDVYSELKNMADVAIHAGSAESMAGNPSGTAKNIMVPMGFGYLLRNPLKAVAILIPMRVFTELYLSDAGRQWLTKGFTLPAISNQAVTVAAKITGLLLEHQKKQLENQGEQQ